MSFQIPLIRGLDRFQLMPESVRQGNVHDTEQ